MEKMVHNNMCYRKRNLFCSEKICINSKFNINIFQKLKSDNLNRNRTSPFAFTGNKFEFRMVGSSMSIAYPITVINTIMANELCQFADILENGSNFDKDLTEIIVNTIKNHKKIIFNGNNYSDEWHLEAKKRHLFNFKTSANAISQLIATKNIEIFEKYKILTKVEISAIYNVLMQNYCQTLHTEAMVMDSMIKKQIIPSTEKYIKVLCDTVLSKKQITAQIDCSAEIQLISLLSTLFSELCNNTDTLKENLITSNKIPNLFERSKFYYKKIFPVLNKIRKSADKIEQNMILPFNDEEEKIYVANLAKANKKLQELYDIEGSDKMQILKLLTRLRQLCLEPRLVYDNIDQPSSKLKACMELIKTMQENKQKVLLFSSFTSVLDLIAEECQKAGITYYMLTGSTNKEDRRELVSRFQKDDTTLFLISLKAGGTGLNLTSAEVVIHFDPWWNVSAQNQATDRAYRIGQKNNVQVFNLVMKDSVEEKIIELQKRKKELADMFVENNNSGLSQMSKEDILSLFTM